MANKKITDLNAYSASQVQPIDLLFITDIAQQETKKITAEDLADYVMGVSGSQLRTGSFTGSFYGVASQANTLTYPNFATASRADTASYAYSASNSIYAQTASYAVNGGNGASVSETVYQSNSFNIGDAVCVISVQGNTRYFAQATSSYIPNSNYNEVVGVVQSCSPTQFTVVYGGVVNFATAPSYLNPYYNGVAYFLNGLGTLSATDPSGTDSKQISKPVLVQLNSSSALVINQRGIYENVGNQITASYVYWDGITNNGTVYNAIYCVSASYASNGGGGGGTYNITNNSTASYYFDTTPIGAIMAYTSGSAPTGWLPCDGAFYPITGANGAYTALYNVISQSNVSNPNAAFGQRYTYNPPVGSQSGSYVLNSNGAYFKVPDLRGIFVRGYNNGLVNSNGANGGTISTYDSGSRTFGSLQTDAFKSHTHNIVASASNAPSNGHGIIAGANSTTGPYTYTDTTPTLQIKNTGDSETRPVNIALYYYIKYTQYAVSDPVAASIANGSYPLSGDVGGTLATTTVTGIRGVPVSNAAQTPTSGAILQYNGSQWTPNTVNNLFSSIYRAGISNVVGSGTTLVTFSTPLSSTNYSVAISWDNFNNTENCFITGALSTTGFSIHNAGLTTQNVRWIAMIYN